MDRIRVGTFELFPGERQLRLDGRPVELGARAFDLLLVLVENRGRLVSKATLLERVWPRLVVDENNLPAQIASLRRVLGAGAIRTIPKFGYRLDLEVGAPGDAAAAPPPPLPPRHAHHWLGALVGRDDELRAVHEALEVAGLLTIVGAAGIGKTRLAQEILARQSDRQDVRVAWVSLEPLEDIALVPGAIALALGMSLPDGADRFEALRHAIEQAPVVLFLDGAEHLGAALAKPLGTLLWSSPGLRVVVTSQAPLGIAGETVYRLAPLSVPEPGAAAHDQAQHGAVALFAQRVRDADRRFELGASNVALVAEICRRLDGNPLALELAAARVPALGLATLLERLDDRFRLLKQAGGEGDRRHDVLQAAFDWSYGLLSPAEQRVFDRLGAFAGSFSLNAAARCVADDAVDTCGAIDLIGRLADRSLVTVQGGDLPRYRLLETARCYANDRLAATGEREAVRGRMAGTMLQLLDRAYDEYWSQDEAVWLSHYEQEIDNVRAAIEWARRNDGALAVSLFGSAWPLFAETDLHAEGRSGHDGAVALLSDAAPLARVARFWEAVATYDSTRQHDRARYAAELAAGMHAATGDARARYYALLQLALNWRGDDGSAQAAFAQARGIEDPGWPARLLAQGAMTEGALLASRGEYAAAREAYRRALNHALTMSERQALAATVAIVELDVACGAIDAALQLGRPLALSLRRIGRRETRFELLVMVMSAQLLAGDMDAARQTGAELYALAVRLDPGRLYMALDAMALLACRDGRGLDAARITAFADAAHEARGLAQRGPAAGRLRAELAAALPVQPQASWNAPEAGRNRLDEASACRLALGLE
ncbi:MAG TPA: winged helix-turn-helix domain-containing protein [Steroidobacteraceae bacterium]|nr:winged helix-turn-helix domain-containing protein [Steroidobacteraceae bacterium]